MDWKKRLKYGSYATMVTVLVFAIFVLATLIVSGQNWKIDMTKNKIYSLSDQTKQVLSNLKQDINIYVFYIKGMEDKNVNRLIENYKKQSKHLNIQYLEAVKHPTKVKEYENIVLNSNYSPLSIVFETENREKVINYYEMLNYSMDKEEFIGEQKFTNAIKYVTTEKIPIIYFLQGHKEPTLDKITLVSELLRTENYEAKSLDLLSEKNIPEDAEMIIDVSPQKAFFSEEITELERFFNNGGKGMFLIDPIENEKQELLALKTMLAKFGIDIQKSVVIESNPRHYYQDPTLLIPEILEHEITNKITNNGLNILIGYVRNLKLNDGYNNYEVNAILRSSSDSWAKTGGNKKISKEAGDIDGPLDLVAVAAKKIEDEENKETRILVAGSSSLISDTLLQNGGNMDFFLNAVGWLRNNPEEITIRPKQTLNSPLAMDNTQRFITNIIVLILIPGAIFITGLVIWIRRRHL